MSRLPSLLVGLLMGASLSLVGQESHRESATPTQLENLELFFSVHELVKDYYVDTVDKQALLQGALKGMMDTLDNHSSYLTQQSFDSLSESFTGEYFGYGLEVEVNDSQIHVITPLPDSSAEQQGIEPGDELLQIDNLTADPDQIDELVSYLKSASLKHHSIDVTLQRDEIPLNVRLIPTQLLIRSTIAHRLSDNIGLITISSFTDRTAEEIQYALSNFSNNPLRGLILDLRDNPGGSFEAAIDVADMFIKQGVIVSTHGRFIMANSDYTATSKDLLPKIPIAVLINNGSASSAEILAGALKDHSRVTLIGERSYGKGTVQSLIPLSRDLGAIKITTARYAIPSGAFIDKIGIEPDLTINSSLEEILDIPKNWREDPQIYAAHDLLNQD